MSENLAQLVDYNIIFKTSNETPPTRQTVVNNYVDVVERPLKEFFEVLEIYYDDSDVFTDINTKLVSQTAGNSPTISSVIHLFSAIHYKYISAQENISKNPLLSKSIIQRLPQLVTINSKYLRTLAIEGKTKENIAGIFITEIFTNFPGIMSYLNAKTSMEFVNGVRYFTNDITTQAKSEIEQADQKTREAIAAEDTAETSTGVSNAIGYWKEKYNSHRNAKWIMFFLFLLVLAIGIAVVFFGESLLPAMSNEEVSDPGYKWAHYLRVVIVPTLAIAWLLRLISRQFITHLLLQEDARLRQTLVLTFLGLQRNADAEIADKERAHMLEAIFRPLPVTPNGDVNQPSFADIAKVGKI